MTLLDVIEVEIATSHRVRIMATGKTEETAEGVIKMAVYRRGVESHFFTTAPTGKYRDGDVLSHEGDQP